ncbi:maleylpyruvate isomerase family mycothiol-dependent enzyme [Actinocorallia sp. B10E7]|uniref:maleylpyruvate isomerase family mycothiol-dependent enzyme n=1 Tax=Actinocorallia sp. B10E7 TaxID=3153558 RepID=UPI00325C8FBC
MIEELRAERRRLITTLEGLTDEEFDKGRTLCAGWSPRDVLGHVIGIDYFASSYGRLLFGDPRTFARRLDLANEAQAERVREMPRARLMEWAASWADRPSLTSRLAARFLLGDLGVHHQDILRGLGLSREIPEEVSDAVFREGLFLSPALNKRIRSHRVVPTDGGRPRGPVDAPQVHGTREALGMWLTGRDDVVPELKFD